MGVTRDGFIILIPLCIATILAIALAFGLNRWWWLAASPLIILLLFSLWFFRDPERTIPGSDETVVSPGDGKVLQVVDLESDEFIGGKAQMVSIFLSVFNVHVNRNPVSGIVRDVKRFPGKFLIAYDHRATNENNRLRVDIESPRGRVRCVQVTGAIARRIVCHLSIGDSIVRGNRYGMIRFGSRMDLVIPASAKVQVKPGDIVHGGETVIAIW